MADIVYLLTNESMPGLVKVGRTNGDLAVRIRQLFQTGVPLPFEARNCAVSPRTVFEGPARSS